jgi:hypothetical protein
LKEKLDSAVRETEDGKPERRAQKSKPDSEGKSVRDDGKSSGGSASLSNRDAEKSNTQSAQSSQSQSGQLESKDRSTKLSESTPKESKSAGKLGAVINLINFFSRQTSIKWCEMLSLFRLSHTSRETSTRHGTEC